MKFKAILLGVGCSLVTAGISVYAQTEVAYFDERPNFGVIPKSLTKTDAPVLYSCESGKGEVVFTIYDADWNATKEFSVKDAIAQTREVVKQRKGVVVDSSLYRCDPIEVTDNGWMTYQPSLAAATEYAAANGYTLVRTLPNGAVRFINGSDRYSFYEADLFGEEYPRVYLVYDSNREDPNAPWFEYCEVDYRHKFIGDWEVVKDEIREYSSYFWLYYYDFDDNSNVDISWSECPALFQNLFTTGGKYEYFRPVWTLTEEPSIEERDRDYDGEIDEVKLRYYSEIKAIEVLADGNVVKSFDLQCNSVGRLDRIIKLNGVFYMWLSGSNGHYIYRIDSQQNSLSLVKSLASSRMYPSVLRPGDAVTIDFGTGDTSVEGELIVSDTAGRVVERRSIPAGTGNLQIDTRRLRAGSYNFTVYRGGKVADNGKVLIR